MSKKKTGQHTKTKSPKQEVTEITLIARIEAYDQRVETYWNQIVAYQYNDTKHEIKEIIEKIDEDERWLEETKVSLEKSTINTLDIEKLLKPETYINRLAEKQAATRCAEIVMKLHLLRYQAYMVLGTICVKQILQLENQLPLPCQQLMETYCEGIGYYVNALKYYEMNPLVGDRNFFVCIAQYSLLRAKVKGVVDQTQLPAEIKEIGKAYQLLSEEEYARIKVRTQRAVMSENLPMRDRMMMVYGLARICYAYERNEDALSAYQKVAALSGAEQSGITYRICDHAVVNSMQLSGRFFVEVAPEKSREERLQLLEKARSGIAIAEVMLQEMQKLELTPQQNQFLQTWQPKIKEGREVIEEKMEEEGERVNITGSMPVLPHVKQAEFEERCEQRLGYIQEKLWQVEQYGQNEPSHVASLRKERPLSTKDIEHLKQLQTILKGMEPENYKESYDSLVRLQEQTETAWNSRVNIVVCSTLTDLAKRRAELHMEKHELLLEPLCRAVKYRSDRIVTNNSITEYIHGSLSQDQQSALCFLSDALKYALKVTQELQRFNVTSKPHDFPNIVALTKDGIADVKRQMTVIDEFKENSLEWLKYKQRELIECGFPMRRPLEKQQSSDAQGKLPQVLADLSGSLDRLQTMEKGAKSVHQRY